MDISFKYHVILTRLNYCI